MEEKSFDVLESEYSGLWQEGKLEEAVALVEKALAEYPENMGAINLDMACLYLQLGQVDKSLQILKEATEKGIWYSRHYFRAAQGMEQFDGLFAQWDKMQEQANRISRPECFVKTPRNYERSRKYPLFIAVHGWGEDVRMFGRYWQSELLSGGFILAMPQSSQKVGYSHYCWNDTGLAYREILEMYGQISEDYSVDMENIFIGGFSQGATLAMDIAINEDIIPVRGFIALNPDKPAGLTDTAIRQAADRGLIGLMITGDQDQSLAEQQTMKAAFDRSGLQCGLSVIAGWGHWFPGDLGSRLDEALGGFLKGI